MGGNRDLIDDLSQTLIAVIVLIGGGIAILSSNPHAVEIMPLMSLVIGFYFGTRRQDRTASARNGKVSDPGGAIPTGGLKA